MTLTQGVFAFCGGVLAPMTGFLAGWRLMKNAGSPVKGFVLGFLAVFFALVASGFVAIFLFPNYSEKLITESSALLFTIPGLVAAALVIRLIVPRQKTDRRFLLIATIFLILIYLSGIFISYQLTTWSYRKALPWGASLVKEYVWTDGFLPDFAYYLRADVTEKQFKDYVQCFNLKDMGRQEFFITEERAPWWKPSSNASQVFALTQGDWHMEAIYDNGTMWVHASEV